MGQLILFKISEIVLILLNIQNKLLFRLYVLMVRVFPVL